MKHLMKLVVLALALTIGHASAATKAVNTATAADNMVVVKTMSGKQATFRAADICRWTWVTVQGERFTVSRSGSQAVIGGVAVSNLICSTSGSGSSKGAKQDEWAENPTIVKSDGEVIVRDDEDPIGADDSTEEDGGPDGLGTPDDPPGDPEPERPGMVGTPDKPGKPDKPAPDRD